MPAIDVFAPAATRIQDGKEDCGKHAAVAVILFDVVIGKGHRLAQAFFAAVAGLLFRANAYTLRLASPRAGTRGSGVTPGA